MIVTRKLGKIFRGKATPAQLTMAAILGTTVGFMPGFIQAPGLLAVLFLAAVVLNANLAVIGVSVLIAGLLSIPLLPVTFKIGRFLLEGPLEGLFAFLVNAPVFALFGFEYYVTTGGLVVGLTLGSLFGYGMVQAVRRFRQKMVDLDKNSEAWKRFNDRRWVKGFVYIFIGGGLGKKMTYEDVLAKKGRNPFRPLGLVAAGLMILIGFVVSLFASDQIVGYVVQSNLEKANGATVDLERAELSLRDGRMTLTGLAMSDPKDLRTDLFRADLIEADISQADLLRKRIHIERLRVVDASSGEDRRLPGRLTRPLPKTEPPAKEGDGKTLEDYFREAQKWRDRLAQVSDWLDRFSGSEKTPDGKPMEPEDEAERERRLLQSGYRNAIASHLVKGSPTVLVSVASVERMRVAQMPDETLDIAGENLSTHPSLVEKAPRLVIRSSGESLLFDVHMAAFAMNPGSNTMEFVYIGLPVDSVAGGLKYAGEAPMKGGTLDLRSQGSWTTTQIDMPLDVTLRNTRMSLAGIGETSIEELLLPIGVSGAMRNPRIRFNDSDLADALAAAGKAEVARRLRAETDKVREKAEERLGDELRERTRGLLDGRLPGR